MFHSCATCQFAKPYADDRTSKNGQLVYCSFAKLAVHHNGICDEFARNNVRAARMLGQQRLSRLPCHRCGFTEYAHALAGMDGKTCAEYQLPALAIQDELFPLTDVVKLRSTAMDSI